MMPPESGLITARDEYLRVIDYFGGQEMSTIAIDTETTGLSPYVADEIRGMSVADHRHAWYIPFTHPDSTNFDPVMLCQALQHHHFVFHHGVFDWAFLAQVWRDERWWAERTVWDTQVVNWLMDENLKVGLKPSTERIFGTDTGAEQAALKALKGYSWATYTTEQIGEYAAMDARLTYDLWQWQEEFLPHRQPDIRPAIPREMEVQRALSRMIATGIVVDPDIAADGEAKMLARLDEMNEGFAGQGVNPASPKDVARWLFDERGWPCEVFTAKGARSTAVSALTALVDRGSEEAKMLLEHRHLQKAITAYFRPLRSFIGDDGRVHPHFSSTRTVTGRFSCSNPNLQTIPQAEKMPEVRACFQPAEGYELWEYDLKQAELRVIAGYANEEAMIDALEEGRDLHGETAASIFGPNYTDLQRRLAKNLNFGFAYGIGPAKFATYISPVPSKGDVRMASEILAGYRRTYPKVAAFLSGMEKVAKNHGTVPLHVPGRFRHFKGAGYTVPEYTAVNFIVQGGIGEFMKDVMIEWYRLEDEWREAHFMAPARLCLQVHDSLWFEVPKGFECAEAQQMRLQGIADRINPFKMRMEFDRKQIA